MKKITGKDDIKAINYGFQTLRSSLKIIDEALEYALCRVLDRGIDENEGNMVLELRDVHSLSKKEDDDEIEELAAKCYESDSEFDVPIKHPRGVKKKKTTLVLERTTCSNKHY